MQENRQIALRFFFLSSLSVDIRLFEMNITYEQALCMFFGQECTEDNISSLQAKMKEQYDELQLCYESSPTTPILVTKSRMHFQPFKFKPYLSELPMKDGQTTVKFTSDTQVIKFINTVFCPEDIVSNKAYESMCVQPKDVFLTTLRYTDIFDGKSLSGFRQWCTKNKVAYMGVNVTRKRDTSGRSYSRQLAVLNKKYHMQLVDVIIKNWPNHKQRIQQLKDDGYLIVGYARKSPGGSNAGRVVCLESMTSLLKDRSLVDKVFASHVCRASDRLSGRDMTATTSQSFQGSDGTSQGTLAASSDDPPNRFYFRGLRESEALFAWLENQIHVHWKCFACKSDLVCVHSNLFCQ
ncbi:hypothetical protein DM01DRAFT_1087934 [Hesseltinella vesiculosa]|uniref:Uncharacterized protein n=1 Tax=Hesseltinella vesiculosa TaxID=101127 RepID=A0A1X2GDH8_9FUNG|nr:hypothetical protein DM01DRAFT_1087934 [Hesseltinella vesiculosa]